MNPKKQQNIQYFREHVKEFLESPYLKDKFAIIYDGKIQATADTFEAALNEAVSKFPADEFIVQQVVDESAQNNFLFGAC